MSHAPGDILSQRHRSVRAALASLSLDGLVVASPPNITYLTNFTGSAAIAVLTAERLIFLTDFRYVTVVAEAQASAWACPGLELVKVEGSYDAALAALLQSMAGARVGFEAEHTTVARHRWLTTALDCSDPTTAASSAEERAAAVSGAQAGREVSSRRRVESRVELVPTSGIVERARARKDAYELRTLTTAAQMLAAAVPGILSEVRRGRRERDVAFAIDTRLRQAGFERTAFETIVAAGAHAALPHARPGERTIDEGDLVVLDFGGVYDSYCVDLTRTISIGPASARAREVYDAVLSAHDLAIGAVRPGVSRFAIDEAARGELARRGLGDVFGHGTGHGLGLEVHERPRIGRRRPDVEAEDEGIEPSMVFTIEPGAYLPGWGGVRIEDDVVATETGVDVLTRAAPTELMEV